MNNLNKLSNNKSILCIEKDKVVQNKIIKHLKQNFNSLYQSTNGLDGLDIYIKKKPDIVILDLSLEKMDSIELIVNLKELNNNLKIIAISEDNDNYKLLKTIDMGLDDIILKPLSLNKLDFILKRILLELLPKKTEATEKKSTIHQESFNLIKRSTNNNINLINTYKGIVLHSVGTVENYEENIFQVKVSKTQLVAAKNEKSTILKFEEDKYIYASVLKADLKTKVLTLVKPKFIDYKPRNKLSNRITVDQTFKATIFNDNSLIELKVIYISFQATSLYIKSKNINIKVGDQLDLTLGFDLKSPNILIKEKKFTKIFAKAKVIRIDKNINNTCIVVLFDVQKAGQNTFKKYLQQREMETIHEFKNKLRV